MLQQKCTNIVCNTFNRPRPRLKMYLARVINFPVISEYFGTTDMKHWMTGRRKLEKILPCWWYSTINFTLTALELNFSSHCLLLWRNVDINDYTKIQIYLNLSFICFLNKRFKQHGTSSLKAKWRDRKGKTYKIKLQVGSHRTYAHLL